MNIPIYRAYPIIDDEYRIGYFVTNGKDYAILTRLEDGTMYASEIDALTLAIHFPNDMLDSQGNKIFASLSEDGEGGDILETEFKQVVIAKYKEYFFFAENETYHCNCFGFKNPKVIGIQE